MYGSSKDARKTPTYCIPCSCEPGAPVCHQLHTDLAGGGKQPPGQLQRFFLTSTMEKKAQPAPGTSLNTFFASPRSIFSQKPMLPEGMGVGTTTTTPLLRSLGGAELIPSEPLEKPQY